jgi:hypothetical protein
MKFVASGWQKPESKGGLGMLTIGLCSALNTACQNLVIAKVAQ